MTPSQIIAADRRANAAAARFMVRCAQAGEVAEAYVDRFTIPLFPLSLILECEGTLRASLPVFPPQPRSVRHDKLVAEMLKLARQPWNPRNLPGMIPEPSDEEKVAFAHAFARASAPHIAPTHTASR